MNVLTPLVCIALASEIYARGTPPSITIPTGNKWPNPLEYVRRSTANTFSCKATADPTAKYYWTLNGTRLLNNDPRTVVYNEVTGTLTTGSLFGPLHSGDYQCIAYNDHGKTMTPFLYIQAARADAFPGQETTAEDVTADVSKYLMMECKDVPISVPPWKFSWERGKMVSETLETSPLNIGERMIIDPRGNLHFLWTEMTDNDYIYTCVTRNDVLLVEVKNTQTIRLNVKTGNLNDRVPELKYVQDVEVRAGETAELTCIFTYYSSIGERLQVDWYLRGEHVGGGYTLTLENVKLPSATQNKEGEYLCEASLGTFPKVRGFVHLRIVAPPEFLPQEEPLTKSVPVKKDAIFKCTTNSHNSYGNPPVWLVNAVPLIGCPPNFSECKTPKANGFSQCIEDRYVCDNSPDCTDDSDEANCPGSCPEYQKLCYDKCILETEVCYELKCDFPGFMCHNRLSCLPRDKKCDGRNDCTDSSDEYACPNSNVIQRNRFQINSQRTELTLPRVSLSDSMCFQCMVTNDYGTTIGDGCLTVIDKIMLLTQINDTYNVEPGYNLYLQVEATTDVLWQNQMNFRWFWYDQEEDPQTKEVHLERKMLPPQGELGQYFQLSQNEKSMFISYPEVPLDNKTLYNIYYQMKDRKYTIVIEHPFDKMEVNFTTDGVDIVKPNIDECASSPCINSGTCQNEVGRYICYCVKGFTGSNCETDIDECASSPCINSGTCQNEVGRYMCYCVKGFTGSNCEIVSDAPIPTTRIILAAIITVVLIGIGVAVVYMVRKKRVHCNVNWLNVRTAETDNNPELQLEMRQNDEHTEPKNIHQSIVKKIEPDEYTEPENIYESIVEEMEPEEATRVVSVYNTTVFAGKAEVTVGYFSNFVSKITDEEFAAEFKFLLDLDQSSGCDKDDEVTPLRENDEYLNYKNTYFIHEFNHTKDYIANVGPLEQSGNFITFWKMIWQHQVKLIVMLTDEEETEVNVYDRYWPEREYGAKYDDLVVICRAEQKWFCYTIREFEIQSATESRRILQYQYTAWKARSIPTDKTSFVEYYHGMRGHTEWRFGPIFVDSRDISRVGTFIALDKLIGQAEAKGTIDVLTCVRELQEKCGMMMIQTIEQYIFLYQTVAQILT